MQPNFKRDNEHCFVLFGNRRSNELRKQYARFLKLISLNKQIKSAKFSFKMFSRSFAHSTFAAANNWCNSKHECQILCYYRCQSQKQFISKNVIRYRNNWLHNF